MRRTRIVLSTPRRSRQGSKILAKKEDELNRRKRRKRSMKGLHESIDSPSGWLQNLPEFWRSHWTSAISATSCSIAFRFLGLAPGRGATATTTRGTQGVKHSTPVAGRRECLASMVVPACGTPFRVQIMRVLAPGWSS